MERMGGGRLGYEYKNICWAMHKVRRHFEEVKHRTFSIPQVGAKCVNVGPDLRISMDQLRIMLDQLDGGDKVPYAALAYLASGLGVTVDVGLFVTAHLAVPLVAFTAGLASAYHPLGVEATTAEFLHNTALAVQAREQGSTSVQCKSVTRGCLLH